MQDLFIEFLPPWVETGLQPAFYDRESGTVLQQTARMYAKVNELVKAVNGMDKIIKEYVEYIDNYFKNLDVQEEINVKLDDMADKGELASIIAQFLEVAPVFGFSTISDMAGATNLISGSIARVLGNTEPEDGDGAFYLIRDAQPGDSADGVYLVEITGDDSIIAERIQDAGLEEAKADIQEVADAEFSQVKVFSNLIYNAFIPESFQGSCVDENNIMYQYASHEYDSPASANGTLYKFNIANHTYVGSLSNVPFYHGNSLVYDNGYIWACATLHDSNPSSKIVKYNVSDGTSEEYSPFSGSFITKTSAMAKYGNKLMICGSLSGNNLSSMKFALLDKTTMLYNQYTLLNPKHFSLTNNVLAGLTYSDGKFYLLTDSNDLIFELIPDDAIHTLTINKVYSLPNQNDLGLEIGEMQGLTALPESYYGKKSFILGSFMSSSGSGDNRSTAIYVSNINLESDLPPTAQPADNQYYPYKLLYIHVSKSGGSNLIEDGTADRPFKTLKRAIEYANSLKSKGMTVAEIYIDDNEAYDIGNIANLDFVINSNDYEPSLYAHNIFNCNITIKANNNIKLYKVSSETNIYINYQSKLYLDNVTVYSQMYLVRNSGVYSNNLTVAYSGQDWMTMSGGSEARLNILSADNVTRHIVNNRNSSLLLINDEVKNMVYTDHNAYTIVGSTS